MLAECQTAELVKHHALKALQLPVQLPYGVLGMLTSFDVLPDVAAAAAGSAECEHVAVVREAADAAAGAVEAAHQGQLASGSKSGKRLRQGLGSQI